MPKPKKEWIRCKYCGQGFWKELEDDGLPLVCLDNLPLHSCYEGLI